MKLNKAITLIGALVLGLSATISSTSSVKAADKTDATATLTTNPEDHPLELLAVPNINFTKTEITGTALTIKADKLTGNIDKTTTDVKVQNPALEDGWNVSVKVGNFTETDGSTLLKGAQMSFDKGTLTPEYGSIADDPNLPSTSAITLNDKSQIIMSAAAKAGIGTFNYDLTKDASNEMAITLNVPSNNTAGTYTAPLTWTLTNDPSTLPAE